MRHETQATILPTQALLHELVSRGVELWDERGDLCVRAPRGALTGELRASLKQRKLELLDLLAEQRDRDARRLPTVVPDPAAWREPFPPADLQLAFQIGAQEGMDFHVRPHYYGEFDVDDLDPERFRQAWQRALDRHRESLVRVTPAGELAPLHEITPFALAVDDLRALPAATRERRLAETRERHARQELPLDRWPWFTCHVSRLDGRRCRVHLNSNSFFSDGFGGQKLMREVQALYEDPDLTLPPLAITFRDCVLALEQLEQSPIGERSRAYWHERLEALPRPARLPRAPNLDPACRSRLERRTAVVPAAVWQGFKRHAAGFGLTPSNGLYAAYTEVLATWVGRRHFTIANMVTRRLPMHPQVTDVFGNFSSLFPLEVDLRPDESFGARAQRLQTRLLADLDHMDCSGIGVLSALNERQGRPGQSQTELVIASGLFMEPLTEADWGFFGKPGAYSCLETPQVLLDHQFFRLAEGGLYVVWDVNEQAFPDDLIDDLWQAYLDFLTRLGEQETAWHEARFDHRPARQRQHLATINATDGPQPTAPLHAGLAASARSVPETPAVITPDVQRSYAELAGDARRIAGQLRGRSVVAGRSVAIVMRKGWEQVAAAFGILQAEAVYVPVDPSLPRERLHHVLAHAEATCALTQPDLVDALTWPSSVEPIPVVAQPPAGDPRAREATSTDKLDQLAYIIYTSGSTGLPKGVMIDHRGARNTVDDINERFGIGPADRVFGISSLSFDLSVYDLFGTAAAGATLVLPDADRALDPLHWWTLVREHRVTVWNSVPALMQLLTEAAGEGEILPDLRLVMLSGDWIPVALPEAIRRMAPHAEVISLGGATEASIWSIIHPIRPADSARPSVPYGLPMRNQRWHVLSDDLDALPVWVEGDLFIAGDGLALGYWRDPQKSAASFFEHPRWGRLYRTGDRGRYLPNGEIEFLGRKDFQVKVQGLRIELGEIEAALLQHPAVTSAVVTAAPAGVLGVRIVAYVVAPDGPAAGFPDDLLAFLGDRLPAYMMPAAIIPLDALPLSSNGKVDRQALPEPDAATTDAPKTIVPPRTERERWLVDLWCELLAVDAVSVDDDFFALGGTSLAATRMLLRINQEQATALSLAVLLDARTIEALARRLDAATAVDTWSPLVPVVTTGTDHPLLLVHPAGGNVLCYTELGKQLERPILGLQAAGVDGGRTPDPCVATMAARYLAAIDDTGYDGPYVLGGWSSGGMIAHEMARQLEARGDAVRGIVMIDSPAPMQHTALEPITSLLWFLEDLALDTDGLIDPRALADIDPSRRLTWALAQLHAAGAAPAELVSDALETIFAVFCAVVAAGRDHQPGVIDADLLVLRARDGAVSEFADHPAAADPDWGWRALTRGAVDVATIPGTHHTVLNPPNVARLALRFVDWLACRSSGAGRQTTTRKEAAMEA